MAHKFFTSLALIFFSVCISAQNVNNIAGKYFNEERKDTIIIYKAMDGLYYGKNPSGEVILQKLIYNAASKKYNGTLTPPGKDFSMKAVLSMESPNKLQMDVTMFLITRTNHLTRIQ